MGATFVVVLEEINNRFRQRGWLGRVEVDSSIATQVPCVWPVRGDNRCADRHSFDQGQVSRLYQGRSDENGGKPVSLPQRDPAKVSQTDHACRLTQCVVGWTGEEQGRAGY